MKKFLFCIPSCFQHAKMTRRIIYGRLKAAVSSGSTKEVRSLLSRANIDDIHGYFCKELPAELESVCVRCEALLMESMRYRYSRMVKLLLEHGACPPAEICATQYRYGRRVKPTSLKLAVESGSVDDVRKLLLSAGADVNMQPRICANVHNRLFSACSDCDSPLMAAVRRRNVAMMRLLITHGANVSAKIQADSPDGSGKTALLVAAETGDEQVITELVTSGADVNQSLALQETTVLHHFCDNDQIAQLLLRLGADPKAGSALGVSVFWQVLRRGCVDSQYSLDSVLRTLRILLPNTSDLGDYLKLNRAMLWLKTECVMLLLQQGARIKYNDMFLVFSPQCVRKQHSEEFIDLLRAADTDFSGVRQRIASLDRKKWEVLNLDVLEEKLSQPLTLQTSCVISVRRLLLSISGVELWPRIDELPLPTIIKDRVKLILW